MGSQFTVMTGKEEEVVKLAAILKHMDKKQAAPLLLGLINDLEVNQPQLVSSLKKEFFDMNIMLAGLNDTDLSKVINPMSYDEIAALISNLPLEKMRMLVGISKNRQAEIIAEVQRLQNTSALKTLFPRAVERFCKYVDELALKHEISIGGLLGLFYGRDCFPVGKKLQNSLVAIVEKECYKLNEPITMFIITRERCVRELSLYVLKKEEKHFSKDKPTLAVYLDNEGCAIVSLPGFSQYGKHQVLIEDATTQRLVGVCEIFVLADRGAVIYANFLEMAIERAENGTKLLVTLLVNIKGKLCQEALQYTVICSHCGNLIAAGTTDSKDGLTKIDFFAQKHEGRYMIEVQNSEHHYATVLTPPVIKLPEFVVEHDERLNISVPASISYGDALPIKIQSNYSPDEGGLPLLVVVTSQDYNMEYLKQQIVNFDMQENSLLSEEHDGVANQKINDLCHSGQILLSPSLRPDFWMNIVRVYSGENIVSDVELFKNNLPVKGFRILILRRNHAGCFSLISNQVCAFQEKNKLLLKLPYYLEKGEYYEGGIHYYACRPAKLVLKDQQKIEEFDVSGHGTKMIKITPATLLNIELNCTQGGEKISHKWAPTLRTHLVKKIHFLSCEENFNLKEKCKITLYFSPRQFMEEIMVNGILKYRWGCGEQTSSKLGSLGYLYKEIEEGFYSKRHEERIIAEMYAGFSRMTMFRKAAGLYSMWEREDSKPSVYVSQAIYRNLLIYGELHLQDNLLAEIIQKMREEIATVLGVVPKLLNAKKSINHQLLENAEQDSSEEMSDNFVNNIDEDDNITTIEQSYAWYLTGDANEQKKTDAVKYILDNWYLDNNLLCVSSDSLWGSNDYLILLALEILIKEDIDSVQAKSSLKLLHKKAKAAQPTQRSSFWQTLLRFFGINSSEDNAVDRVENDETVAQEISCTTVDNIIMTCLTQVCRNMESGMVGSTQTSLQLVRVLKLLVQEYGSSEYLVGDTKYTAREEALTVDNSLTKVINGIGIIGIEKEKNMTLSSPKGSLNIEVNRLNLDKGGHFTLKIEIKGKMPFSPLLKLYLPWHIKIKNRNVAQLDNLQCVELPISTRHLTLGGIATTRGCGIIKAELTGMYRNDITYFDSTPAIVVG